MGFGFVFQSQGVDSEKIFEKSILAMLVVYAIFIQSRKVYFSSSCLDMPSTYSLYYLLLICDSNSFDVNGDLKCIVHQRRCYTCIHVYMYTCIHVYMYTCTTAELLAVALSFVQVLLTELYTRCTKCTIHMLSLVSTRISYTIY